MFKGSIFLLFGGSLAIMALSFYAVGAVKSDYSESEEEQLQVTKDDNVGSNSNAHNYGYPDDILAGIKPEDMEEVHDLDQLFEDLWSEDANENFHQDQD